MNVPLTISAFISSIYFKRENSRRVQLPSISRQLPPMGRSKKLDAFLQFYEYDLLNNIGKVSTEVAEDDKYLFRPGVSERIDAIL